MAIGHRKFLHQGFCWWIGTIWVDRGEHPSSTRNFKRASPPFFSKLNAPKFVSREDGSI